MSELLQIRTPAVPESQTCVPVFHAATAVFWLHRDNADMDAGGNSGLTIRRSGSS